MVSGPSGRQPFCCGDCGACSRRLSRCQLRMCAVVLSCRASCCVRVCSAACVPCLASVWRWLLTTQICGPSLSPGSRRRYWIVPSHQIQSPVWSLRKGCWTFAPFSNPGYASGGGGAGGAREDDEDAWAGWGGGNDGREDDEDAWSGFAGWVRWGAGVGRSLLFRLGWGRVRPLFVSLAWVGLEVAGLGGRGVWRRGALLAGPDPSVGVLWRLHVRFRVAAHEVSELAHGLWGIRWPWWCGRAVVEGVVKVVVPHGLSGPLREP